MNREYALPGVVAIVLAVLYPLYWLSGLFVSDGSSLFEIFRADVTRLSAMDGLFVLIGLMEIYLFMKLRHALQQQLNGGLASSLALCMAIGVGLMTATVLFDVVVALGPGLSDSGTNLVVKFAGATFLIIGILIGLVGLLLAISLLAGSADYTVLLKLFAVVLLICSLMFLSVILAPIAYIIYPVALLLLAAWFLRGGGEVEVV